MSTKERRKIVVLGAGPTAMGALYRLNELAKEGTIDEDRLDVVVLEKENQPGGLARSVTDPSGFSWDLGVHITGASKYPYFIRAIDDAIDDWNLLRRSVQVGRRVDLLRRFLSHRRIIQMI